MTLTRMKNTLKHNYLGKDSLDITKNFSIKNTVGIALREGFNKWAKVGTDRLCQL